jgi:DNA-binding NarL/FixJ family response regulator
MRIALCCKEPLFGQALTSLLSHEGNFDVVASESKPRACISAAKDQRAQVIIVDSMGLEKNELEFLMGARAYGDFGVALVMGEGEDYSEYGVDKLYSRGQGAAGLIKAIREVGNAFVRTPSGRVRESRGSYGNKFELSRREFEVASLVAKGYSNRKISEVVGLKEQSVKNLVSVIMRKLKCENRVQVALRLSAAKIEDGD